jgi:long-chain fatty acid transport protein
MRRALILSLGVVLIALPAVAQNVSIESLSGLQFNFGNPGARSLGMGGAFLGLADDASAAEANPAGLTILRKAEFSIEGRNYLEQQVFTTSGTFPDLERTPFNNYSQAVQLAFASAVFPIKNRATVGVYFHQTLENEGAGNVFPEEDPVFGTVTEVPRFFLPAGGTNPVSADECDRLNAEDFGSCSQFNLNPFVSALSVDMKTFGVAGGLQLHPRFSIGATVRYHRFEEGAVTFRFNPDTFALQNITGQATAEIDEDGNFRETTETDITYAAGFKWSPTDKISIGGVYKIGAEFDAPAIFSPSLADPFIIAADTRFHVPDVAGIGVSFRPIPTLTLNFDAVRVEYSNLVDDPFSFSQVVRDVPNAFEADDIVELHFGGEYYFPTRIPFAIRGGYWRDPAHSVEYVGPLDDPNRIAEAVLFPEGEDQDHFSIGAGLAWPRFQIDIAYDTSDRYKVGSVSVVTRF